MDSRPASFFVSGGTMAPDTPSYVERRADRELCEALLVGELCYVLTSRQMGKSSLMVRTSVRLAERGVKVAVWDLTALGQNLTAEQWYDGLVSLLGRRLGLDDELEDCWFCHSRLSPLQRMMRALQDVILPRLNGQGGTGNRLVIFVDEMDVVRSLPFCADEFLAAIRECYNRRSQDPEFRRLTFCLLGVGTPSDLIRDKSITLFNIGRRIELRDFTPEEAAPLAAGLFAGEGTGPDRTDAGQMLERILYWTNGHPYLTQRLCHAVAEANDVGRPAPRKWIPESIDRWCETLFLSNRARERDDNLVFVRERILGSELDRGTLLRLYDRIRNHEWIPDDEASPFVNCLRFSGITRVEDGVVRVRNRIYEAVFSRDWIMANLPLAGDGGRKAIAVLPFVDLTPDHRFEIWCDGLSDELIQVLGQVPGLKVASRSSTLQVKGRTKDICQIASELRAQYVLEGHVGLAGNRLRIFTQLVHGADGYSVWTENLSYAVSDLPEVQAEIARALVERFTPNLAETLPGLRRPAAPDLEAYHLYLRGRFQWNKRSAESVQRGLALLEQAILRDPNYALAHAGLADAYSILGTYNYLPPAEAYPKAKTAALKALAIDDSMAQAHATLGCVSAICDWDWVESERRFRRAIELNPSYAAARQWFAINCLTPLGRFDEALAELGLAQEVDPLSTSLNATVGLALHYAGRRDEAVAQFRLATEMDPDFWLTYLFLGWTLQAQAKDSEACAAFRTARGLSGEDPLVLASLAHAAAVAGRREEAERELAGLSDLRRSRYIPAAEMAIAFAGLGEIEEAMKWFERGAEERSIRLIYLHLDPRLRALRSEPRFMSILARIGADTGAAAQ